MSIIQNATVSTTSGTLLVGRFPATSLARTLMRFPNLSLGEIEPEQITAATVELRDLMCQDDEDITVECCIYNMSAPAWSESGTITWSSVGTNYLGSVLDSHLISYGQGNVSDHRYSFNIVTAAKAWAEGTQSPAKGLVFKANSDFENQSGTNVDVWRKTFASYNRTEHRPSLSISYIDFTADAESISVDVLTPVIIPSDGTKMTFEFSPLTTGFYTFESSNIVSGDPMAWLYNYKFETLFSNDDAYDQNFRLTYHLIAGYKYYFMAGCYRSDPGSYNVKITKTASEFHIVAETIAWGYSKTVLNSCEDFITVFRFTPSVTDEYLLCTMSSSGDPKVWIYNSDLSIEGIGDDGAGGNNSRIALILTGGQSYYIVAGHFGSNTGPYDFLLAKGANITTATCHLKNVGTNQYMDIHGPESQERVHQWTYHTGFQERWRFAKDSAGYYTIRSQYDQQCYVGISSTDVNVDNVRLYSSLSDNTKWKVYLIHSNQILLEPKNALGTLLYAPNTIQGSELQLVYMGNHGTKSVWEPYTHQYDYEIKHYLDQGFFVRIADIDSNAVAVIKSYQDLVAERFLEIFGVQITPTYYTFTSSADTCKIRNYDSVSSSTINQSCSHMVSHLTTTKLRNDLDDGTSTTSIVIWTGHLMQDNVKDRSNSNSDRHSVVMTPWLIYEFDSSALTYPNAVECQYVYDLMHELSHQLGLPDHYCYNLDSDSACQNEYCDRCQNGHEPRQCLMSGRFDVSQITNEDMYCWDCITTIRSHLQEHH